MFNVMLCGTPGTGKSTLVERIKSDLDEHQFSYINISKFALANECTSNFDEKLESHEIDEDKLLEKLRPILEANKRNIVEAIEPDLLPADLFNLAFVCRTDNTILYDRLKRRNYSEAKISENVSAEIFQVIADEAREAFDHSQVIELVNEHEEDLNKNARLIVDNIRQRLATSDRASGN